MKFTSRLLHIIFCGMLFINLNAQERPPIQIFTPEVYGGENQNWMISQASNRYIYVANNAGLLEYNGTDWRLYNSPNNTIMRSVKVVDDRIYTGCYMGFGYWLKNKFGHLIYTSLVPLVNQKMVEDEQIWNIISFDEWILFQTLGRIYMFNKNSNQFKVITGENPITKIFKVKNEIYYQETNKGVFKLQEGSPKLIINAKDFKSDLIIDIIDSDKGLMFLTENNGFYILNGKGFNNWKECSPLFSNLSVYSGIQLKDKSFLIGTISHGLIHVNSNGKTLSHINLKNGLTNNTILSLLEDDEGNIWAGLDNGINCINLKSPLRIFNDKEGLLGTVYASKIYKNNLYLGTNQGLFYREIDSKSGKFNFIENTNGQVWCLEVIDNKLFCGHNLGTFIVDKGKVQLISDWQGTWQIKPIKDNEDLIIQGNYSGLNILQKVDNKWIQRNKIKGFNNSARFFEFISPNELWVNHEYKGIFKLTLSDDYRSFLKVSKSQFLPKGKNSSLVKYKGQLFYAYKDGLFKYSLKDTSFSKDSLYSQLLTTDEYLSGKLVLDDNQKLWAFSKNNINYITSNHIDNKPNVFQIPIPASLRKTMTGYESIMSLSKSTYLIGIANGYINLDISKLKEHDHSIFINGINLINNDKNKIDLELNTVNPQEFNYQKNSFKFNYSVPEYDKYTVIQYQYKLEGLNYSKWSAWSKNTTVFFENLPPTDYKFHVRAKVGNTLTKNEATYSFIIKKPWFLSTTAVILYCLIFILILTLVHRTYKKYYANQREKLVEGNRKRLEHTQLESDKEIMFLRNSKLRQDIESKNRELAISTMSLIKKNELLNTLKKELKHIESKPETKSVIKIIDNNLNNNNDWEFFEEAFNNADKNFLNKVKDAHPDLTPNDLRFCAYLRLNLSSKEIAPLLNISVRSIEIKRYRLRKKMNLPHQKSLVSYILEI